MASGCRAGSQASAPEVGKRIRSHQDLQCGARGPPFFGQRPPADLYVRKTLFSGQRQIYFHCFPNLRPPDGMVCQSRMAHAQLVKGNCVGMDQISRATDNISVTVYKKQMPALFVALHVEATLVVHLARPDRPVFQINPAAKPLHG